MVAAGVFASLVAFITYMLGA